MLAVVQEEEEKINIKILDGDCDTYLDEAWQRGVDEEPMEQEEDHWEWYYDEYYLVVVAMDVDSLDTISLF